MEDQLTKEVVKNKISDDFDTDLEKVISKAIIPSELPNWNKAETSLQNKLQFVLRRVNLAKSLQDDDISKWMGATNEVYELNALRTYLLLSAVNLIGEIIRVDTPMTFLSWLDTSNSITTRSIREESISKAINSVGVVDDQKKAVKLIKSVFAPVSYTHLTLPTSDLV